MLQLVFVRFLVNQESYLNLSVNQVVKQLLLISLVQLKVLFVYQEL